MAESNGGVPPSPTHQRRKSFAEMLNPRMFGGSNSFSTSPSNGVAASPGVPAQRKNSISIALGLSAANGQDSPYNSFAKQRRASISNSSAGTPEFRNSFDENAVIEDDDRVPPMNSPPSPSFARRLSFGAQALRDVRQSGTSPTNNAGRRPSSSLFTLSEDSDHTQAKPLARSPGTAKTGGEGFNWSDATRDNRRASIASSNPFSTGHIRSRSTNTAMLEPVAPPPREISQPVVSPPPSFKTKKPDHLGERMLRGDFMMD